jgi:methyl-accepting chemotaxis protein
MANQQQETHQEIVRAAGEIATAAEQTASGSQETAAAVEEQVASFGELTQAVQDMANLATRLDRTVTGLFKGNKS